MYYHGRRQKRDCREKIAPGSSSNYTDLEDTRFGIPQSQFSLAVCVPKAFLTSDLNLFTQMIQPSCIASGNDCLLGNQMVMGSNLRYSIRKLTVSMLLYISKLWSPHL